MTSSKRSAAESKPVKPANVECRSSHRAPLLSQESPGSLPLRVRQTGQDWFRHSVTGASHSCAEAKSLSLLVRICFLKDIRDELWHGGSAPPNTLYFIPSAPVQRGARANPFISSEEEKHNDTWHISSHSNKDRRLAEVKLSHFLFMPRHSISVNPQVAQAQVPLNHYQSYI